MSSVTLAQELTLELGALLAPEGNWKRRVSAVHAGLVDERFPLRLESLKWSRVKTWFYGEVRRVDHHEVVALQELKALREAQREHREFIATTNRLAAFLAAEGEALTGKQMAALGRIAGRQACVRRDHVARALPRQGEAHGAGAIQ